MADDATPQTVEVPATTSPAASATTPAPSAAQTTTQTPDSGGITDADFAHPEYGAKLKNAYTGMQKAQQEAAQEKKVRQGLESGTAIIRTMIQEDPSVAASMVRYLESKGQTVPAALKEAAMKAAAAQQGDDDDDTRPLTKADLKKVREELNLELGSRDVTTDFMRLVGGGDVGKGSVIYYKDGQDILNILDELNKSPMSKQLLIAHELLEHRRKAASRPTQTETQPAATSDMGRANGGVPSTAPAVNGVPDMNTWLAQAGFSSEAEYLRALRQS